MNISKNKRLSLLAACIILALFHVVAFVIPFVRGKLFWTGYGFSTLAILLTVCVSFYALGHEGLKSKFYGWPLLSLAWRYATVQLIAGLLEMAVPSVPFPLALVFNTVLLAGCLIGLIGTGISKNEIERIDEKIMAKVFYIKSLQADVEALISKCTDHTGKTAVKELAEALRYSDPISSPFLAAIEQDITAKVAELAVIAGSLDSSEIKNMCHEIQQLITERNQNCKLLK